VLQVAMRNFKKYLAIGQASATLRVDWTPFGCAFALCLICDAAVKGSVEKK